MPGSGAIRSYHNRVIREVNNIFNEKVQFSSPKGLDWHKVRDGSRVDFDLSYEYPINAENALRSIREQSSKNRVSVFPLLTTDSYLSNFWVSWHETWKKENSQNYILLNSGWTLFSGLQGSQDKDQILRVEWDQLPHQGSKQAGHPHWHFDHDIPMLTPPERTIAGEDLIEIEETPSDEMYMSLGYIHLAMGAWNEREDHPKCWQRDYGDDCNKLHDWCIKTLKYIKEQVAGN